MATTFYSSFKPQVLSRQEGFHLPSPAPSTPPSSDGTPSTSSGNNTSNFDTQNLFMSPPSYLSVPETFRKFPGSNQDGPSHASMDFTEELASLIANPHPSSHTSNERSTQSPVYDDYRPQQTHNIFDISAPTSHHQQFSLPSSTSLSHSLQSSSSLHGTNPLQEFSTHAHFNSTVPAIGSSMRYEPPAHSPSLPSPHSHPFALNTALASSSAPQNPSTPGAEPSSVSSFSSQISSLSAFSNLSNSTTTTSIDPYLHRTTPSPPLSASAHHLERSFSRSRSRSRSSATNPITPVPVSIPPSTNGGPTRRTRPKRGSVSSVSPPPLHRGHSHSISHTQPLVIPTNSNTGAQSARSPLSLHTSGWFQSSSLGGMGEFSLPTPDSVHGGFSAFGGPGSLLNGSPKDLPGITPVGSIGISGVPPIKSDSPPADLAAKQAMIANEKRRRRRESHNAVERRRRDNINEKISELATLIPECLLDPNATLTMPASLSSSTADELLFPSMHSSEKKDPEKKVDDDDGEKEGGGVIKANKGMILRKSVEYIRYLQQLVSAQASRNRDLEQQLQSFRSGTSSLSSGSGASLGDEEMLMLHEEVGDFNLIQPTNCDGRPRRFTGLESVAEMDHDGEQDHDMDRPSTAISGASPLSQSGSEDAEDDREEEERGRKGRDGRPGAGAAGFALKTEEGMETS